MLRQPYLNRVTMAVITKETDVNDAFQMKYLIATGMS